MDTISAVAAVGVVEYAFPLERSRVVSGDTSSIHRNVFELDAGDARDAGTWSKSSYTLKSAPFSCSALM